MKSHEQFCDLMNRTPPIHEPKLDPKNELRMKQANDIKGRDICSQKVIKG